MTTPDILQTVGFEKSKIGSGEKEMGYQIGETSLCSLVGSLLVCFGIMGVMVVFMVFDIHLEKKNLHKVARVEEHHAAEKLARVQMELWSQYRDDISESREAHSLLKEMDTSYDAFKGKFKGAVDDFASELHLNHDKASSLADKILHLVADMQQDNIKHAKRLLEHLVKSGKRSEKLEKHVSREIAQEMKEEKKNLQEDEKEGIDVEEEEAKEHAEAVAAGKNVTQEEDPLKKMLEGFFWTFHDYEGEFGGKPRQMLTEGQAVYEDVKKLHQRIISGPISEDEVTSELDKIDLKSVGAGLGAGRILPVIDIVEELFLLPKIPFEQLKQVEKLWRADDTDAVEVFERLKYWHSNGMIPSGWLQQGVERTEKDEDEIEDEEEKLDKKLHRPKVVPDDD